VAETDAGPVDAGLGTVAVEVEIDTAGEAVDDSAGRQGAVCSAAAEKMSWTA
jgi:hypothetical protein